MRKGVCLTVVLLTLALPSLGSCTLGSSTTREQSTRSPRPTATTTVAPDSAIKLADRYRKASRNRDVYGIQHADGPGGVPLLTVWTRSANTDAAPFDRLKVSLTDYLKREEKVDLRKGYVMDVFGPDGGIQHRLDARP